MKPLLVGLIGAGIQRSRSPALHEAEARAQGLDLAYKLIDLDVLGVNTDALHRLLEDAVRNGYRGLNITFPCKQLVMPLLDSVSDEARAIGAVNTIVIAGGKLAGHNTDSPGWSWAFRRALPDAKLERVVLLGAGGAGSAIAHAAIGLGVGRLVIVDRDPARAKALKDQVGDKAELEPDIAKALQGADGLVQATPVGMEKHPGLPLPEALLRKDLWVSEVVYVPLETELLKAARRIGCRVMDGGHMNVGQAALGFELFTGRKADLARMDAHFRRLVG